MNISKAAAISGLPPKTIRYYEAIGLIENPGRRENGYRDYSERGVQILKFLNRARSLGFSVDACRQLLALYSDPNRTSAEVKTVAQSRIDEIDRKIEELETVRATLMHLVEHCHGDHRPDCPILDDFAGHRGTTRHRRQRHRGEDAGLKRGVETAT